MTLTRRSVFAAVAVAVTVVGAPAAALGTNHGVPDWMQRMMDDAPPEMQQTMRSPEMTRMMESPEMRRMMERPRAMDEMIETMQGAAPPR